MFAQMKKDIDAIMLRDPAAKTRLEAALCYPGLHAIWVPSYSASLLYLKGWVVFPRLFNTFSRFLTGIDIHPVLNCPGLIDHGADLLSAKPLFGSKRHALSGSYSGGTGKEKGKRHPNYRQQCCCFQRCEGARFLQGRRQFQNWQRQRSS